MPYRAPNTFFLSPHAALFSRPPFDSAQEAKAFNQSLHFDTSNVTDMTDMFDVRSAHTLYRPTPSF